MMIKSIAIEVTDTAFLPESYAYRDYFRSEGFESDFVKKGSDELLNYDAALLFYGFHPFWCKYPDYLIGEYNSLSVGRYSRAKDLLKRILNVQPNLFIFLNDTVRKKMWYTSKRKYLLRGMGYDKADVEVQGKAVKKFDVVYSGSLRSGVWEYVQSFIDLGLSVAVIGNAEAYEEYNLVCFGRILPKEAREIMVQARYGLNFTPDKFPLNIQDSTKVIEYCAAGLGVITNRYQWVNEFEESRCAKFLDLDTIKKIKDVSDFEFIVPDVQDLDWKVIMNNTNLLKLL